METLTRIRVVFQVSHALHLSAVSPSYYRFHVEHLQSDDYSKDKVEHKFVFRRLEHLSNVNQFHFFLFQDAPALIGEMDSSGSLNAHALLHLTERVRARTVFQVL